MVGITNITVITIENVTSIANTSNYGEFLINVNQTIYGGYLYFILLFVAWIIFFFAAQQVDDQPMANLMYSGAVVSAVSLILRAVEITENGIVKGLLTDYQMWIFPVITIILATWLWVVKDD